MFTDYCHKKVILANKVLIDEDELANYLIDGIAVKLVWYQAMMQRFPDKKSLSKAMENMTLGSEQKSSNKLERASGTKLVRAAGSTKTDERDVDGRPELKCFNCNEK